MFKREPSLIVDRFPRDVPLEQGIGCSLPTLGQVNPVEVHLFFQKQSHFNPHFNSSQSQQTLFLASAMAQNFVAECEVTHIWHEFVLVMP